MEGGIQESGAGGISQDAVAGRGDTRKTTSVAADEARVGGRYGARPGLRESIAGQQENQAG